MTKETKRIIEMGLKGSIKEQSKLFNQNLLQNFYTKWLLKNDGSLNTRNKINPREARICL